MFISGFIANFGLCVELGVSFSCVLIVTLVSSSLVRSGRLSLLDCFRGYRRPSWVEEPSSFLVSIFLVFGFSTDLSFGISGTSD